MERFCERAFTCLHFGCILNRFNKDVYLSEFGECSDLSLLSRGFLGDNNVFHSYLNCSYHEHSNISGNYLQYYLPT